MSALPPTTLPTPQPTASPASPNQRSTEQSPPPTPSYDEEELPTVINTDTIPHLTDLLNRPAVRLNEQKRAWVQAKLMAAQMEMKALRRGRRQARRSGSEGEL